MYRYFMSIHFVPGSTRQRQNLTERTGCTMTCSDALVVPRSGTKGELKPHLDERCQGHPVKKYLVSRLVLAKIITYAVV